MTRFRIGADLKYDVRKPTVFLFQISAAQTSHQQVISEELCFKPLLEVTSCEVGGEGNQLTRVDAGSCELEVSYRASVDVSPIIECPTDIEESIVPDIPPDVLTYLNPSRYCESDLLGRFAFEEFGQLHQGFSRVQTVCDWVNRQLDYVPGSTSSTTTASDVLLQRTGVCRDYAHLAITLCRGIGIPARYVSGYAVNLQPPDFHGFMEAFLDGQWYLFDPTQMAPASKLIRIGVGRDAADVSFATLNGQAVLTHKKVWASDLDRPGNQPDDNADHAVSTA